MKKFTLVISIILVLSMLLAACQTVTPAPPKHLWNPPSPLNHPNFDRLGSVLSRCRIYGYEHLE